MADYDDYPDLVDGADPINTGTVVNEAWWDLGQAALQGELRGATDPTRTNAADIDEMLAARGGYASLSSRLTAWEAQQYVQPLDVRNGFAYGNCAWNGGHVMWSRGDAAPPDGWSVDGAPTVARCGSGLADTEVFDTADTDHFSCKLTYGAVAGAMYQNIVQNAARIKLSNTFHEHPVPVDGSGVVLPGYASTELVYAYVMALVRSIGVNRARIGIGDLPTTANPQVQYSAYHPGDSAFHPLLAGPFAMASGNLDFSIQGRVELAGDAHFMHWMVGLAPAGLPPMFLPEVPQVKTWTFPTIATPTAATGYGYFIPPRPVFIVGMRAYAGTAPTGATTLKLDLMTPIGGAYVSLFNTLPAFVAADIYMAPKVCDPAVANYRRRTIRGIYAAAAALADNSVLRLDVNTRDSGNTGANIVVEVDYLEFPRPFMQWRSMTDLGE